MYEYVVHVIPFGSNCSCVSSWDSYALCQGLWMLFKIPKKFGIIYDQYNFKNKINWI
jgi:hypothetical protein